MSGFEFLERLDFESAPYTQRWLVRSPERSTPHIACFIVEDPDLIDQTEEATRRWIGPLHPRITAILDMSRRGGQLVIETEDDRGPPFAKAARQLADPIERERWAIAQIICIADGLAVMRQRDRSFVHRRLGPSSLVVDVAGHVRLRAPIAVVEQGPRPSYVGRGPSQPLPWTLAPEQARGRRVGPQADVFALACTLYHVLTGEHAFKREGDFATLRAIIEDPPPPLATHAPGIARVLEVAFAKDPKARHPDPATFAGELWRCVPDAMEYDAVISDRIVAWRATADSARRERVFTQPACRMPWEQLVAGADAGVRHCNSCQQDVVRVSSLAQIVPLAGRCVAYTGGD